MPKWKTDSTQNCSVHSLFSFLNWSLICPFYFALWKNSAPKKIRIYIWSVQKNLPWCSLLLAKKGWNISSCCYFSNFQVETVKSYILDCPSMRGICTKLKLLFTIKYQEAKERKQTQVGSGSVSSVYLSENLEYIDICLDVSKTEYAPYLDKLSAELYWYNWCILVTNQ